MGTRRVGYGMCWVWVREELGVGTKSWVRDMLGVGTRRVGYGMSGAGCEMCTWIYNNLYSAPQYIFTLFREAHLLLVSPWASL